jgi:hypothetical protein
VVGAALGHTMGVEITELLTDAFGRIRDAAHGAVEGASRKALTYRPDREANSVAWLVWHLTRIQDDHVAGAAGAPQRWLADGWCDRFGLPLDPAATGYGQRRDEVAAVDVDGSLLLGYLDAVHDATVGYLAGLDAGELDRIVDERWDPPVSLGVRLVSVVNDDLQHVGQAAYVRGLAGRAGLD